MEQSQACSKTVKINAANIKIANIELESIEVTYIEVSNIGACEQLSNQDSNPKCLCPENTETEAEAEVKTMRDRIEKVINNFFEGNFIRNSADNIKNIGYAVVVILAGMYAADFAKPVWKQDISSACLYFSGLVLVVIGFILMFLYVLQPIYQVRKAIKNNLGFGVFTLLYAFFAVLLAISGWNHLDITKLRSLTTSPPLAVSPTVHIKPSVALTPKGHKSNMHVNNHRQTVNTKI